MLPSRLFRNTGIPPALRSLVTSRASLPATVSVQLRLRLGVLSGSARPSNTFRGDVNAYSTTAKYDSSVNAASATATATATATTAATTTSQALPEAMEPRLSMTFTCTVEGCGERSSHQFTKRAYENGIVLVQCPSCKNRHLIADHLGWFKESTQDGKLRTVEDMLRARGEKVRRGRLDAGGVVEYAES